MYQLSYIKFEDVDFDLYHRIVDSEAVMKYVIGQASSLERSQQRFQEILVANETHQQGGYYKIYDRSQLIGLGKLEYYPKEDNTIEVGYLLMEDYWGMGYGSQVAKDLIQYARNNDLAKYVIGIIDPENLASRKILLNLGLASYFVGFEDDRPTEKLRLKL